MPTDFSQYLNPADYSPGALLGNNLGDAGAIVGSMIDPIGAISSLFGGEDSSWKPYVDENGNYVWTNPKRANPVPVASVPGTTLKPSKTYKTQAQQIQALIDLLPYLSKAVSGQIIPQAQATLEAQRITSPGFAQLMQDLYSQFGPKLNEIANQIARQNAVSQVGTDAAALEEAKKSLLPNALEQAKLFDPEFFATRSLTAQKLADLMKSIDLSGGLSETERREIEQGLVREGSVRGTTNAPSALETVGNAMRYGQAGYNRVQQNRSALSQAIAAATGFLPTSRTGTDVFQVATGRSSIPNVGQGLFTGPNNVSGSASTSQNLANSLLGNIGNLNNTLIQSQTTKDINKKDWADYLSQVTGSIANLGSAAGAFL